MKLRGLYADAQTVFNAGLRGNPQAYASVNQWQQVMVCRGGTHHYIRAPVAASVTPPSSLI